MRRLLILLLFLSWSVGAASFSEFYVQPTGNNLNAGSTSDDNPTYTATGGFWTNATGVWRKDGETLTGVTNGAWASVYPDATTVNPVFIGRVTNVTSTNIWISLVAKAGTSPVDDFAGATTIRVGGAWSGPNTNQNPSSPHPFNFVTSTMTNTSGNVARINFKGGTVYNTTNAITAANVGPIIFEGYTTSIGDNGFATLDGGAVMPGYILLTVSANLIEFRNFIFSNNGASGNTVGVAANGYGQIWKRCVFHDFRGSGLSFANVNGYPSAAIDCEAYWCNRSGATARGGFAMTAVGCLALNCIARDNTNANTSGFYITQPTYLMNCIAYNNANCGALANVAASFMVSVFNCDFNANSSHGIDSSGTAISPLLVRNVNSFRNGGAGFSSSGGGARIGLLYNNAVGSGIQTNASGGFAASISSGVLNGMDIANSLTYTANATPWVDSTNGNYSIASGALTKAAGYNVFYQSTVNSPTNTVSYPDIGAAQSASTNSASAGGAYTWAQ